MAERGLGSGLVLAGVALIATCYGFARFAYGLFARRLADEFPLSVGLAGLIAGGGYVGYCLAIGLSTVLTSRRGPRAVAVLAGTVATAGMVVVALSGSAPMLAVGVLVAGSSTGLASPPLAAAVAGWVRGDARDTAQTVVNSGTGIGVLVSGPVALVLLDQWRPAWGIFAAMTAAVTVWVAVAVPSGRPLRPTSRSGDDATRSEGALTLVLASLALGLSSAAVWTFGQDLVSGSGGPAWLAPVVWMVIGAAGIAGAFSGPMISRLGVQKSWTVLMVLLVVGVASLPSVAGVPGLALADGAVFGAAYIALTGVLLVWATRTYPGKPARGVGLGFFMIALGQAIGASLVGLGSAAYALPTLFDASALLALAGAFVPVPRLVRRSI